MSDTIEIWKKRVASWRASGETAEAFSQGRPWAPKTLRWYASRVARGHVPASAPPASPASPAGPVVRIAQLVRGPATEGGAVVVEVLDAGVRVTIEAGAMPETIASVLGALVVRGTP